MTTTGIESTLAGEALREAEEALVRVNRAATSGVVGASIAYELSQPLCAIVASAAACSRWLAAEPPNLDRAQRALGRIANEGRRASEIIDGIRVLVQRQASRRDIFDLNEAILEVLRSTHDEEQRNQVSLETSLAEGLPLVECGRTQVQQVVLNLVVNAIQAMRAVAGRPRRLAVGSSREGPSAVRVEVRHSGCGVDLGLSISRAIIEAHGGRLWVGPNEPHGAAFCFSLPI
jgi:C4-dicarboxylate-specific signal transduction histidine kinase